MMHVPTKFCANIFIDMSMLYEIQDGQFVMGVSFKNFVMISLVVFNCEKLNFCRSGLKVLFIPKMQFPEYEYVVPVIGFR